jgi:AbiV family abortive infection protein
MAKTAGSRVLGQEDISSIRDQVLENTEALIGEAELLAQHKHYRRAFALAVIAIEEASKNLILVDCAIDLAQGRLVDWPKLHKKLTSHQAKLKANLLLFRSLRLGKEPDPGHDEYRDALARVADLNLQKQAAFYVWIDEGGPQTTSEHISDEDKAITAIKLAKISPNVADAKGQLFDCQLAGRDLVTNPPRFPEVVPSQG